MPMPRRSPVWNYFTEIEGRKAQCNYCCRVIRIQPGGIGNLRRHLKRIHPQLIESIIKENSIESQSEQSVDPLKLDHIGDKFIESVKNRHCLWKTDTIEFKNQFLTDDAWDTVADENSISVREAQIFWKNLKDGFRRAVISNAGVWKYEEQMNFLLPYIKLPKQRRKTDEENEILEATRFIIEPLNEDEAVITNDSNTPSSSQSSGDSTLKKFFSVIYDTTAELPDDLQVRVQRQLFNIVMEAKEESINRREVMKNQTGLNNNG